MPVKMPLIGSFTAKTAKGLCLSVVTIVKFLATCFISCNKTKNDLSVSGAIKLFTDDPAFVSKTSSAKPSAKNTKNESDP
jgi:hypothetical protein